MKSKKTTVIANWKMYMPYNAALEYCTFNRAQLDELGSQVTLICCPSTTALHSIVSLFKDTTIHVGAQNCSEFMTGAYTGQVEAQSLAQIGCSYCIIGHSECRSLLHETNDSIAAKLNRLLENNIRPIICIGETHQEYAKGATFEVLQAQLEPIFAVVNQTRSALPLSIAYEPVWAIGSGIVPTREYLITVFTWLAQQCATAIADSNYQLIYGGSVNENSIKEMLTLQSIDGFLIGGASLDFQNFKKIVSLL